MHPNPIESVLSVPRLECSPGRLRRPPSFSSRQEPRTCRPRALSAGESWRRSEQAGGASCRSRRRAAVMSENSHPNRKISKSLKISLIFDHLDSRGLTAIPIAPDALRPAPRFSSREAARVTSRKRVAAGELWRTSEAIGGALCTQRRLGEQKIFENRWSHYQITTARWSHSQIFKLLLSLPLATAARCSH